mmetsp:Transcript_10621/g.15360  ORF Transcript_10621/g.15360 Transcript_10621/m.15360 type:complete len:242 (-) Transcript_10621:81-806(-)
MSQRSSDGRARTAVQSIEFLSAKTNPMDYSRELHEWFHVAQLLDHTLSSHELLGQESKPAHHSCTAVHDLVLLVLLQGRSVLGQIERVKVVVSWWTPVIVLLECRKLNSADKRDNLEPSFNWDLVDGSDGACLAEVGAWEMNNPLHYKTQNGKHTNPSMLQLRGTGVLQVNVIRQIERVEPDIPREPAVQILGALQERDGLGHCHHHGSRAPRPPHRHSLSSKPTGSKRNSRYERHFYSLQ